MENTPAQKRFLELITEYECAHRINRVHIPYTVRLKLFKQAMEETKED